MKRFVILSLATALFFSCSLDDDLLKDDLLSERIDNLIEVEFTAETADTDSKVFTGFAIGSNWMFWNKLDSVGLFAGAGNINRRFVLSSSENINTGTFKGTMQPVSNPTSLFVYYPYSADAKIASSGGTTEYYIPFPNYMDQEFEGTFGENGDFSNFGKYALLVAKVGNFTISTDWPQGKTVYFNSMTGITRFKISNGLSNALQVRAVKLYSANGRFTLFSNIFAKESGISYYGYNIKNLATIISDKNPLILSKGETKYVQMATTLSSFGDQTESIDVYVDCIKDGRNLRFTTTKSVTSANNFVGGYRTTINVPLSVDTPVEYAKRVKVTTSSAVDAFTAPVFTHGSDYEPADTWWGDSTVETYEAGRSHSFTTAGEHNVSFNHWGNSEKLSFEDLNGITAIDFSDVYSVN